MDVLVLATDGEERVPMEGRHFNVVKSFVCLLGTASSSQGLEVQDHSAALDRNKFFFHPPIPGFVTGYYGYQLDLEMD